MKPYFFGAAVVFFLFSPLFAVSGNSENVSSNWTHYVEAADFRAKVILLNDGSRWELIEGFEDGLIKEIEKSQKKNKKSTRENVTHKKGYPLLQKSIWEKGQKLRITPVYLDGNGFVIQPNCFVRLNKTPYFMFEFFIGEVESYFQRGTYVPNYVLQGPFFHR